MMNKNTIAQTKAQTQSILRYLPVLFVGLLGVAVITLAGHVQASALHTAAHDVRHATGFPSH